MGYSNGEPVNQADLHRMLGESQKRIQEQLESHSGQVFEYLSQMSIEEKERIIKVRIVV